MMMIGIGSVGYGEAWPLKAAIGNLTQNRDDSFSVTPVRCRNGFVSTRATVPVRFCLVWV
jgi:hypothetical protein